MSSSSFEDIKISGMACAVPKDPIYTEYYKKYFSDSEVEQFIETSGVRTRYITGEKQTASDLCYVAAKKIMEHKGYTGDDIDACIFITQMPDYAMPATAFVLHKRLELKENCVVFDINLGCSAFPNGVSIVSSMIKSGLINRGLLLIGDSHSYCFKDEEKLSHDNMLFGDCGSACIIENITKNNQEENDCVINSIIKSDGSGFDAIITTGPTVDGRIPYDGYNLSFSYMNGVDVFLFAITKVPKLFKEFCKKFNCSSEDFDYFIFHQANVMILDQLEKRLKLPKEKVPRSIERYGNTDGATVPLTIVDLCERENIPDKIKFAAAAFGIGLSWGIISFEMDKKDILPVIYTDDYYKDGYLEDILEEIKSKKEKNNKKDGGNNV